MNSMAAIISIISAEAALLFAIVLMMTVMSHAKARKGRIELAKKILSAQANGAKLRKDKIKATLTALGQESTEDAAQKIYTEEYKLLENFLRAYVEPDAQKAEAFIDRFEAVRQNLDFFVPAATQVEPEPESESESEPTPKPEAAAPEEDVDDMMLEEVVDTPEEALAPPPLDGLDTDPDADLSAVAQAIGTDAQSGDIGAMLDSVSEDAPKEPSKED